MWLAQSEGYFARQGLQLDLTSMNSGEASAAALVAGDIVVCSMNSVSLVLAHQNGLDIKIIGAGGQWVTGRRGTQLMVLKNSPVDSGSALNGKTIGVNVLRGSAQMSTQAWIDKHGGDSKTVQWLEIPFAAMQAALESGRVAAAPIPQPYATTALATCRSLGPPNDAIAPRWLIGVYVAMGPWIAAHPDVVHRIRTALFACSHWYNANPAATVDAVAKITGQTPAQVAQSVRSVFGEAVTPDLVQPVIDTAATYGILKRSFSATEVIAAV